MLVSSASTECKKRALIGAKKGTALPGNVDKALLGPCNDLQKGGWKDHDNGRVVCRSLELMTALGMMEDHNRLLPSTESGSGLVNSAMRSRGVLGLICVLVALGSLLYVGNEAQAKPPDQTPQPGGKAASHGPTSQQPTSHRPEGAPNADQRDSGAPALQPKQSDPKPAPREPVDRGPSSRTTHQRPTEQRPTHQRPTERPATGPRHPAEPPGKQGAPHEQRPVHEPPGSQEPGRGSGHQKPVGPDPASHPKSEQADKDHVSRPVHERPAPQTTPHYPHGSEGTGQQEGAGSADQPGKPASPPGRENVHPEGKSYAGPPEQIRQPPEHSKAVGHNPDTKAGNGAYKPAAPEENSPIYKSPTHTGTSANTPGSIGVKEHPGRRPPVRTLADHETGSEVRSGAQPFQRQAGTERGISGPRSVDLRREEPARFAGASSAHPPERRAVESSRTVDPVSGRDAVPAAPPGGKQRLAGERAQLAPGSPFGPAKFLLDPLWDERGALVDLSQEALRSVPGGQPDLSKGDLRRGSLAPRAPPLEIPSPFFGFVPMMGGAATGAVGSSGNGAAPLLAVIAPCLIALLYRGRSRIFCTVLRPGTVPRPALERPG